MSTADTMDSPLRSSSSPTSQRTDSLEQGSSSSPLQSPRQGPARHRPVHDSATGAAPGAGGVVGNRPRSASGAKALLTMALLEAQSAVQMDNDGLVGGAIESYNKAVTLLGKVMEATSAPEERERLKIIHDSYQFRMQLLANPKSPSTSTNEQGQEGSQGGDDEEQGISSQDFPSSVQQQALQSSPSPPVPAHDRSALPRTPMSPPPEQPRSPPPMPPQSPPPHRMLRSPPLGPQSPRSPPLSANKNFHSSSNLSGVVQPNDRPSSPRESSPRRTKKNSIVSQGPLSPLSPSEPRTRRPRAESASASEGVNEEGVNGQGRGRYRTRTHTEGIMARVPENDAFSPTEQQQQRRTIGGLPKVREREALPKVVILRTPPTTPLPPPPQRHNGMTSEPMPTITSPTRGSPATMFSAPAQVFAPGTSSEAPPVPAVPPIPTALSQRIERSRATSPPPRPPRPSSPTLAATHMIMASLVGPDPGRPLSPPPSAPLPISPTLSPTSPSRRMRPLIPAGFHYKQFDIQDLIPNRDQSLPPILEKKTTQEQTQEQEQRKEEDKDQQSAEKSGSEGPTGGESATSSEISPDNETAATGTTDEADEGGEIENPEGTPEELVQEWLPNLLSKSFATSKIFLDHLEVPQEPIPRERVFIKGWYNPSQTQNEDSVPPFNISSTIHEEDESSSRSTSASLPAPGSSSGVTSPVRQQPQASSSSTSLASSLSSSSSTRTRLSISMPILGTGGGETKGRNSGSSQSRGSQEILSPTETQRNHLLQLNNAQLAVGMAYSSKLSVHQNTKSSGSGGSSSALKEATLQDIIAQDPFAGMKPPLPNPNIEPPPADPFLRCFWFMHLLAQTMTSGGFLSPKLYVPKVIWYQKTLIRLPAIDAKINACHIISQILERMTAQSKNGKLNLMVQLGKDVEKAEKDRNRVLKELETIEAAALEQWTKLSKKMSFINRPGKTPTAGGGVGWSGANSSGGMGSSSTNGQYHHQRPPQHYEYQNPHYQPQQRPLHHYQPHDEPVSGPYDWIGTDDPFTTMTTGTLTSGTLSSGALSSGTMSTGLLTSSNLTSSSMSDKGISGGGTGKRATAEFKNQWKSFSKSVQKSIVNEKVEDTTDYTEALIQLFQSSFILESMLKHFDSLPPHQTHIKILNKLQRICDFYNMVVCAFVIRDLGELMVKYVKRMGSLVAE
ncbi:hypothetical protein BGZ58_002254 [Dissophora ornata]|nr:hypothetical protein BGZ58_002254 [Dissophora ornata]